ncbi:MAG: tRNA pseudouridine(55) synthase TruB [Candidatus Omnitrophica bacterium 4484_171]|nr:MAG: tRNA pseudouridine(55) synthase TruB [Candidatus Omnitrophica bacterium 4484_171]
MAETKDELDGLILVNKPSGITSHDVVDNVRVKLGIRRVGHAGTLDPLADGLLVVLIGRHTKFFQRFVEFEKEYLGVLKLGEVTTTGDSEGKVVKTSSYGNIDEPLIKETFSCFLGEIEQVPPMVSAIRVGGRRLYNLARKGIVVERQPRKVRIYELDVLSIKIPTVEFYVRCSKGTYIRKLAEDVGEKLGCGAHIVKIRRLAIGPFKLKDAVNLDEIGRDNIKKFSSFKI